MRAAERIAEEEGLIRAAECDAIKTGLAYYYDEIKARKEKLQKLYKELWEEMLAGEVTMMVSASYGGPFAIYLHPGMIREEEI